MIWVEPVEVTQKTDLFKTINKAKKSVSDFQLYLDHELGKIRRGENEITKKD